MYCSQQDQEYVLWKLISWILSADFCYCSFATRPWCCVSVSAVIKRPVCQSCSSLDWPVKSPVSGARGGPDSCSHTQYFTHAVTLQICHAGFTPDRETLQELAVIGQLLASASQLPVNIIRSIWTLSINQLLLIKYVSYMLYYCMCGMRTRIIALSISGYTANF